MFEFLKQKLIEINKFKWTNRSNKNVTEVYTLIQVRQVCLGVTGFPWFQVDFKTEFCGIGIFGEKTQTYTCFYSLIID